MNTRATAIFRIRIITAAIILIAGLLITRLYYVQVMQHDYYVERAERQYVHTVNDLYDRGSIYFTTKSGDLVSAATISSGFVLAVNPTQIIDAEAAHVALSSVYEINKESFIRTVTTPNRTYIEIDPRITIAQSRLIAEKKIPGLHLYSNQWRYYPGEALSARLVGFVGYSDNESEGLVGRYGLERYYDDILNRSDESTSVNFFAEIFTNMGQILFDATPKRTGDIVTTIEPTVARFLDTTLQKTQDTWDSRITGGIIMNPQNGEIYAMNVIPTFNSNARIGNTIEDFKNPLVEDVYEMGSIIKALTVAAGLDDGAITPQTTYYDSGQLQLSNFTIRNYDGRARGTVNMQEVLNQSLNTGVSFIVDTMGKDDFRSYFKRLRLGSETGIDLPNEAFGLIANLDSPRDVEYATASFGQGIALTPIATVRALAALGNGGRLVTPHVVREIVYQDGSVKENKFPDGEQIFSEETSLVISRMLTNVVDDALRNGEVKLENHSLAAKTGTAQIADQINGGYYEDRFLHSFFGYFPAYDPEYLVFLYTVEPKNIRFASETLTDPFMEITNFLINYYNIPPDR